MEKVKEEEEEKKEEENGQGVRRRVHSYSTYGKTANLKTSKKQQNPAVATSLLLNS